MHPILFSWGPITIHTYGFFSALGFLLAIYLGWRRAGREGLPQDKFLDLAFWILLAGIAGARALYVIVSWHEFSGRPLAIFKLWEGGLVFYGGFVLAVLAAVVYIRLQGLPLWKTADVCAPYIALGHAVGRIGCFFNGCCYGPVSQRWGMVFPGLGDQAPHLPTQLLEAAYNLALFILLARWRPRFAGQVFWWYVALYGAGRFGLEFLRGDEIRGHVLFSWFSTSQLVAVLAAATALAALRLLGRRSRA